MLTLDAIEAERYVQEGQWQSWGPYLLSGKDVHGSTVGIYGMGGIGRAFARRLKVLILVFYITTVLRIQKLKKS